MSPKTKRRIRIFTAPSGKCQLGAAQEMSGSGQKVGSGLSALRHTNRVDGGLCKALSLGASFSNKKTYSVCTQPTSVIDLIIVLGKEVHKSVQEIHLHFKQF